MNNTVMKSKKLKFIDLFSGIGGFRLGMESIGAECVFSSEIDSHAIEMYKENFGEDSDRDITKVKTNIIPNFDILCAGFPCQAFSISGKQKGFEDITRGTLFFDICRILKEKKPKVFVLENVQNLEKHDKGNTLYVMINSLNQLGYAVSYEVLNAKNFGVPQNRERIVIVGNREGKIFDFSKLKENPTVSMLNFLDKEADFEYLNEDEYTLIDKKYIKKQKKSGLIFVGYRNKKIRTMDRRMVILGTMRDIEKNINYKDCYNYVISNSYFGNGIIGLADASEFYFDKDYNYLSNEEFIKLILTAINPSRYNIKLGNKRLIEEKVNEISKYINE